MNYYVEYRPHLLRMGAPKFVQPIKLMDLTGHRGLYLFSEQYLPEIEKRGSIRGMQDVVIRAEELFVEFDDSLENSRKFFNYLKRNNIAFTVWDSGNRSQHFHIQIEPMEGKDIPWDQKKWVEKNAPGADTALYHHAGSIRLPGTYHAKNPGHFKYILASSDGEPLKIEKAPPRPVVEEHISDNPDQAFEIYDKMLNKSVGAGSRTPTMYRLYRLARDAGLEKDVVLSDLLHWNENQCYPPHEEQRILNWFRDTWGV